MSNWKITPADRRAIRAYAAQGEKLKPGQITIEVATRVSTIFGNSRTSMNVYNIDDTEDWSESDLHDKHAFSSVKAIPLDEQGRALVDFYIYEKEPGGFGELLTNVQAYAETVDGKPQLVKLSATGARSVGIPQIRALGIPADSGRGRA